MVLTPIILLFKLLYFYILLSKLVTDIFSVTVGTQVLEALLLHIDNNTYILMTFHHS